MTAEDLWFRVQEFWAWRRRFIGGPEVLHKKQAASARTTAEFWRTLAVTLIGGMVVGIVAALFTGWKPVSYAPVAALCVFIDSWLLVQISGLFDGAAHQYEDAASEKDENRRNSVLRAGDIFFGIGMDRELASGYLRLRATLATDCDIESCRYTSGSASPGILLRNTLLGVKRSPDQPSPPRLAQLIRRFVEPRGEIS